jgi:DeoR/GlpR family transcriptional regulator of sugar metabolism
MKRIASTVLARRRSLAQLLDSHQYLPLSEVCLRLGISEATARRDLRSLAQDKKITRTYGGAFSKFDATFSSFARRRTVDPQVKALIAEEARQLIQPHTTCFFDSGTTIFALAEALYREPVPGLHAVTNSLPAAEMLGRRSEIEVEILGGTFLHRQSILLGKIAEKNAKEWNFHTVFLSAEGFDREGVWASAAVASFQRTILAQAQQVVFCAHATKLGHRTGFFLSPWTSKFKFVSDLSPTQRVNYGLPL